MPEFWKTWSAKFYQNALKCICINGSSDGIEVTNAFAKHFSKVYRQTSASAHDKAKTQCMLDNCKNKELNHSDVVNMVNVEL